MTETYDFVLVIDADPVFEQGLDDLHVALGGCPLQRGVAGLKLRPKLKLVF